MTLILVIVNPSYPVKALAENKFGILYTIWYANICISLCRVRYYTGWAFSQAN